MSANGKTIAAAAISAAVLTAGVAVLVAARRREAAGGDRMARLERRVGTVEEQVSDICQTLRMADVASRKALPCHLRGTVIERPPLCYRFPFCSWPFAIFIQDCHENASDEEKEGDQ